MPQGHVVNDNRWRAAGGKRCESKIEWEEERYPDPSGWKHWLDEQGLVTTLDFNRCIARFSDGWDPAFNLPPIDNIEFAGLARFAGETAGSGCHHTALGYGYDELAGRKRAKYSRQDEDSCRQRA